MARRLPFHEPSQCIECGGPHKRDAGAWRCWPCEGGFSAARSAAVAAVQRAIKAGALKPAKEMVCVDCEAPARDWDHRDYSKPLAVQPVCRVCNQRRGPAAHKPQPVEAA